MTDDRRLVAVVPDSCTLLYASFESGRHPEVKPRYIERSKRLVDFIKHFNVGVISEDIIQSTATTYAAGDLSEREQANFKEVINGISHIGFSRTTIDGNFGVINGIYDRAREKFNDNVAGLLASKDDIKPSRRKGVVSNRQLKKWARKVADTLNSPEYEIMKKKLLTDPPDSNDKYLLSYGHILKEKYQYVFIATDDAHLRPMPNCGNLGFLIHDEIKNALGIRCYQPYFAQKKVEDILKRAGFLGAERTLINQKPEYNSHAFQDACKDGFEEKDRDAFEEE